MSVAAGSFASRWGGLAVWEDEGFEPGVSPYFKPQGLWYVGLPLYLALFAVAAAIQALERRLFGSFDAARRGEKGAWRQQITHVFMTGTLSRAMLLLLLWAPPTFLRQRWDWVCTAPVAFETFAFFWYWRILPRNFKQVVVGHHVFVLLVVWPLARCVRRRRPYDPNQNARPALPSIQTHAQADRVHPVPHQHPHDARILRSRESVELLFICGQEPRPGRAAPARARGGALLMTFIGRTHDQPGRTRALTHRSTCTHIMHTKQMEGQVISSLICLCFAGQRLLRAAALWEGIPFLASHPEYDSVGARCLQVVMIGLEAKGAVSGYKFLPRADEWKSKSSGSSGGEKKEAAGSSLVEKGQVAAGH
jgi:hypothetical protein